MRGGAGHPARHVGAGQAICERWVLICERCAGGGEQRGSTRGGAGHPARHGGTGQATHGPEARPVQRTL